MKKQIITLTLILSTSLMAQSDWQTQKVELMKCLEKAETKEDLRLCKPKNRGKSLEEVKAKILEKINQRIEKLDGSKTCVKNAKTKEELRICKPRKGQKGRKGQ